MKQSRVKCSEATRVVCYARVSTKEQAEKDLSIPAQLDAMRRYCRDRGYEVVEEYIEPGASARDGNRKVFKAMLGDILAPNAGVDAVLVYQTSRFMRNRRRAPVLKEMLRRNGIRVVAIMQETADDPMGNFMEGVFELIDQYESDINGVRTSAALRQNAKQGNFNGSLAPFGFQVVRTEKGGRRRNKLVPEPAEAETLREVFRTYVNDRGALRTARSLNQRGYDYRGKLWSKDLVLKVLGESAAIGTYFWGKRDSRTGEWRDSDEWIPVDVEPIIGQALWDQVQQLREERDPQNSKGRTTSSPLLLAGYVKCGRCGASYQLETSGKRCKTIDYTYRYYNCRSALRTGKEKCPGHRIRTEKLEQAVKEAIVNRVFTKERCREFLGEVVQENAALRAQAAEQCKDTENELADVERRLARWYEAFESGAAPIGQERVRKLEQRRSELRQALDQVAMVRPPPAYLYTESIQNRFQDRLRSALLTEESPEARPYLRALVERITVTGSKVEIAARPYEALRLMAAPNAGEAAPVLTGTAFSPTSVCDWLRRTDSNCRPGG